MPLNPYEDSINTGATAAANMSVARGKYDPEPPPPNMTPKEPPRTPTDRAQDAPMPPPPVGTPGPGTVISPRRIAGSGGYTYEIMPDGIVAYSPRSAVGTPVRYGTKAYDAVMAELGPQLNMGERAALARINSEQELASKGALPPASPLSYGYWESDAPRMQERQLDADNEDRKRQVADMMGNMTERTRERFQAASPGAQARMLGVYESYLRGGGTPKEAAERAVYVDYPWNAPESLRHLTDNAPPIPPTAAARVLATNLEDSRTQAAEALWASASTGWSGASEEWKREARDAYVRSILMGKTPDEAKLTAFHTKTPGGPYIWQY